MTAMTDDKVNSTEVEEKKDVSVPMTDDKKTEEKSS